MSETNSTQPTAQINYNVNDINKLLSIINNNKDTMTIPVETSEVKANKISTNELSADNFIGEQVTAMTGFSSSASSFLASIETNSLKINSDNIQIDVKDSLDDINQSIESLFADLGSNVNEYLQSEEAQDIIILATENTVDTKINTALKDYSLTTTIKSMISSAIITAKEDFLNSAYPVGSLYMSMNSTNPGDLFGGTWEQIEGRFILAADNTHPAGQTDGEETHELTVDEMPSHRHNFRLSENRKLPGLYLMNDTWGGDNSGLSSYPYMGEGYYIEMLDAGGNQPHNNMPPYLVAYIWKRTA